MWLVLAFSGVSAFLGLLAGYAMFREVPGFRHDRDGFWELDGHDR